MHIFSGPNSADNNVNYISFFNGIIGQINYDLAHNCLPGLPTYTGVNDLVDTKIRFELVNIYTYSGSPYYTSANTSGMISYINGIDPSRLNYLPILIPLSGSGTQNAATPWPSYIGAGSSASSLNSNLFAYVPSDNTLNYVFYNVLKHELGHCLDLLHTYEASCCHEDCQPSPDFLLEPISKLPARE
jgi:hypothetical protein